MLRDSLDRKRVTKTIGQLQRRIDERFPAAGLAQVCGELLDVSANIDKDIAYISSANWWLRALVAVFITAVGAAAMYGIANTELTQAHLTFADLAQLFESAVNDVVLIGAATVFLVSLESRRKRQRVIEAINRLRGIAHVVDMHQLTKDPMVVALKVSATASSPKRTMTAADLSRYLDYCSELLSLIAKVGFCYVQDFDDPQAVAAVNELESLVNGLDRRVWQKIMLLQSTGWVRPP